MRTVARAGVQGKWFAASDGPLFLRGVTYGTFRPRPDTGDYPSRKTVARDFALMAANGVNCVRTYTPPPPWLADAAAAHGLWLLVGIPWAQHVAFLDDTGTEREVRRSVVETVRSLAAQDAVL